jgi:hypothetical protein
MLERHYEDTRQLARSFMWISDAEASELLDGKTYWEDWEKWVPSRTAANRQVAS